jgi:hypothetical protein
MVGVLLKVSHQGGRDWLPAQGFSFFPEADEALIGIEIIWPQG